MKKLFYIIIIIPLLLSVSCGKKDSINQQVNKSTNRSEQTNPDDAKTNSSELQMSKGLPDDFPSDIPQPLNGEAKGYFKSSEGTIVNFTSSASFNDLTGYYKNALKSTGFKGNNDEQTGFEDKMFVSDFTKDGRKINIIITKDENSQRLNIVVTY